MHGKGESMADEQQELRRVKWTEVFTFTHIFKSFRMAIHPSKLLLALAAIVILFASGWVMDLFWTVADQKAYRGEIYDHYRLSPTDFAARREAWKDGRLEQAARLLADAQAQRKDVSKFLTGQLVAEPASTSSYLARHFREEVRALADADFRAKSAAEILAEARKGDKAWSSLVSEADDHFAREIDKIEKAWDKAYAKAKKDIEALSDEQTRGRELDRLEEHDDTVASAITKRKVQYLSDKKAIQGQGVFASLLDYEVLCLKNALRSVWYGNVLTGLRDYKNVVTAKGYDRGTVTWDPLPARAPRPTDEDPPGFIVYLLLGVHGVVWLICEHWVFAVIYVLIALSVCALFGGAIHRIAALDFARHEKISIAQALRFSMGKFLSFFTAPLIPVILILGAGVLLTLGGLLGNIPVVGEILMGVLFLFALFLGLGVAFLLIGLVAGAPLMYPTIAVEGSDSFDAMSRSFSYVFNKPWLAILYGLVAVVYGAITYLFVRFFVFLALASTHFFAKWGIFTSGDAVHPTADKMDLIWQKPTFDSLWQPLNWEAMSSLNVVGAFIIAIWIFLIAAMVLAFVVSYGVSTSTVIYYLLRRKVDATDLDDVYVEEAEEELGEPEAAGEAAPAEPEPAEEEKEGPSEGAAGEEAGEQQTEG
jgi:hypothetical protein